MQVPALASRRIRSGQKGTLQLKKKEVPRTIKKAIDFLNKGHSNKIEEVENSSGLAEIQLSGDIRKFSRDVSHLIVNCYSKESIAEAICKEIIHHLSKASHLYKELSECSKFVSERFENTFQGDTRFKPVNTLYQAISEAMMQTSLNLEEEVKQFHKSIKMMFSFSMKEFEGLEEVKWCDSARNEEEPVR